MTYVTQGSLPEVMEKTIGMSLNQRTLILGSIQDLGPPDMVHLTKGLANSKSSDIGTYFYYTGADVSNSATIAALLNSLANIVGETPQLWFGKHKAWIVNEATYCSYNAFSKRDVRVTIHFPGGVSFKFINAQGEDISIDENLDKDRFWLETFMSAIIRSIISADGDSNDFSSLVEIRKINPFLTKENVDLFFKGFELLFDQGINLGCNEELQVATNCNNYLIDTFVRVVQLTGEFDRGINILEKLKLVEPGITYLIARLYLANDQEIKAVNVLHDGISLNPLDGELLILQSEYCLSKNRTDLSLPLAIKAVNSLPSNFSSWSLLVKNYIATGNYEHALLTLNSCPMVTHKDKYHLKRVVNPKSEELHLPLPVDVTLKNVTTLNSMDIALEHDKIDQNLLNLPAGNLKSTFAKAYALLTEIVHKTGWENLLKYRTKVFVMEEEFRSKDTSSKSSSVVNSTENVSTPKTAVVNDEETTTPATSNPHQDFRKKRLCERWLDNLFMILYEDLRVFTMFRAEFLHFDSLQMEMNKTTLEWELLGLVASRLGHHREAATTFRRGLNQRFSVKSSKKLLEYCLSERERLIKLEHQSSKKQAAASVASNNGDPAENGSVSNGNTEAKGPYTTVAQYNDQIVDLIVTLLVWNHRWYCEFSPFLLKSIRSIIEEIGRVKFESEVQGRYDDSSSKGVFNLVKDNLKFLELYGLVESDSL